MPESELFRTLRRVSRGGIFEDNESGIRFSSIIIYKIWKKKLGKLKIKIT